MRCLCGACALAGVPVPRCQVRVFNVRGRPPPRSSGAGRGGRLAVDEGGIRHVLINSPEYYFAGALLPSIILALRSTPLRSTPARE